MIVFSSSQFNDAWVTILIWSMHAMKHKKISGVGIDSVESVFFFFRILKLLNQRKLETLKERWWNQNPQKKVSLLSCVCGWRPSLNWYIFEREKINHLKKNLEAKNSHVLRRVRRRTTTVGASPSTTSAASSSSSSSGSASPSSLLQLNTGQPHFLHFFLSPFPWGRNWLISHGVWFLLVLSRYYKYKAPSTRVSSVEVRTSKFSFREKTSQNTLQYFYLLSDLVEKEGKQRSIWVQVSRKTFLESKTRMEVLKFLRNRSF